MADDIFTAARDADLDALRAQLDADLDLAARDEHGMTALHHAAIGLNTNPRAAGLAAIKLLVDAGSPLEATTRDSRTPLYLAAEFSKSIEPIEYLLAAGAKADVTDGHGNHVVVNAMLPEVKALLSAVTGYPIPPPPVELPKVKMKAAEWRGAKEHLDRVFARLDAAGVICLHDAGTTQEDGFSDCAEEFRRRGGVEKGLLGFCFYTSQDLRRAKSSSQLPLAFWGAPDGKPAEMMKVGRLVASELRDEGFTIDWNESPAMRPTVWLRDIAA